MKIIAFYLPQFYAIPENDVWWGKGFTEWVNTKKAQSTFKGHVQPNVPLDNNYYNLLDNDIKKWQVKLAHDYGIDGFCFYHYWFKDGKKLLEKPVEQFLQSKELNQAFCLSWANEPWCRNWDGLSNEVLMPQEYGGVDEWKKHFMYLLPFFKDDRYIRDEETNSPIFIIYKPEIIPCLSEMMKCWNDMAEKEGIPGITYIMQYPSMSRKLLDGFKYSIEFEPIYTKVIETGSLSAKLELLLKNPIQFKDFLQGKVLRSLKIKRGNILSFDRTWKSILNRKPKYEGIIPGAFPSWDNTSRRGKEASVYKGSTPKKFEKYLAKQIQRTKDIYHSNYLFINAWNEWAEGAYLEPDEQHRYGYLEAIKNARHLNNLD